MLNMVTSWNMCWYDGTPHANACTATVANRQDVYSSISGKPSGAFAMITMATSFFSEIKI